MVRQSHSSSKQFIIGNVTQLVERRQIWRAVSVAPRVIQHRVDALALWRFGETAPRDGGKHQTSDEGGTVDVLQRVVVQPACSHQTLDVLSDREIILDAHAQHLQTTAAGYSK